MPFSYHEKDKTGSQKHSYICLVVTILLALWLDYANQRICLFEITVLGQTSTKVSPDVVSKKN